MTNTNYRFSVINSQLFFASSYHVDLGQKKLTIPARPGVSGGRALALHAVIFFCLFEKSRTGGKKNNASMESAGNIAAPCCLFAALDRAAILFFFLFCGRIAVESGL